MKLIAMFILEFILLNLQSQQSDGVIINCAFSNETPREDFPGYMCTSMSITNLGNKVLESVTGTQLKDFTNKDVDGLTLMVLDDSVLDYIPANIMEFFPKLTLLTILMTNINIITSHDMRQFPRLKFFDSTFNPITSLPGDLFKYNPELRQVGLRGPSFLPRKDESISEIGENIFGGLENLTEVVFIGHFCIQPDEYAFTREEVMDLNQRLPVMCPYANVPTDAPTTEGQTSTSSSTLQTEQQTSTTTEQNSSSSSDAITPTTTPTTTEKTTTSGQNSLVNENQKQKFFLSFVISVMLIGISNV